MVRLEGFRERRDTWFFDTAFAPELEPKFDDWGGRSVVARLFGNRNVGVQHLTNLQVAGVLAADQTFDIDAVLCQIWADGEEEETRRFLDTLEAGVSVTIIIGDKPYHKTPLIPIEFGSPPEGLEEDEEEAPGFVPIVLSDEERKKRNCRSYGSDLKTPLRVPARQNFSPQVFFSPEAKAVIESFKGKKQLRVWVGGTQTRDTA